MGDPYVEAAEAELADAGHQQEADEQVVQQEAQVPDQEPAQTDPAVETEARAMGWLPQDEYKGDPEKWRPADEFVSRGKQILPLVQENLKRATSKITKLESDFKQQLDAQRRVTQVALQRQREQIIADFEARKRQAIEVGDVESYDHLNNAQWQEVGRFDQAVRDQHQQEQRRTQRPPEFDEAMSGFSARNPWYGKDPVLTNLANLWNKQNGDANPNLTFEANLKATEEFIAQKFPEAFPTRQQRPSPVEGSGSRGGLAGSGRRGKGWGDIPSADQAQAEQFVKDGLFKSKDEYAKVYWSEA